MTKFAVPAHDANPADGGYIPVVTAVQDDSGDRIRQASQITWEGKESCYATN